MYTVPSAGPSLALPGAEQVAARVTASSWPRDCLKQPGQLCLSSALGMVRQHDSSALKDAVRMNNRVLWLLSVALGAALMSCWKIPTRQPEELEKGHPDTNSREGSQGTPGQNAHGDEGTYLVCKRMKPPRCRAEGRRAPTRVLLDVNPVSKVEDRGSPHSSCAPAGTAIPCGAVG